MTPGFILTDLSHYTAPVLHHHSNYLLFKKWKIQMTQFINDILNDFDAEFGITSDPTQQRTTSAIEPSLPPSSQSPQFARSTSRLRSSPSPTPLHPTRLNSNPPSQTAPAGRLSVSDATQIINDLRKQRIRDAAKMQELQTENARLNARLAILEHTDLKVSELGSKLEQLLQKYLETEQIRTQQSAQISELRQEVIVLKSKLSGRPNKQ
jgi:hypothetical protein